MFSRSISLAGVAILAFASVTYGQDAGVSPTVRLPPDPPEAHLGFRPGEDRRVADWGQVTEYAEVLARQSDRVRLDTIGRSTLDRPMLLLTITDPANHARLQEIRATQAKLADPRRIDDRGSREALIESGRLIVLITSAIHPTEVAGTLVPLTLAYRLAAATDTMLRQVLRETVVLIVPSLNPDGVDLVADWYRESIGMPWEGSPPPMLYHHYTGHDNNRDWYSFTQVETRNVVQRVYNIWHPQIVHDIHQQGPYASRYFVPPWTDPIEPNVDPLLVAATNSLGTAIAWDMLRQGKKGVTINAGYDAWSPARAYAHYHGGVRVLSETAGARLATPIEILPGELQNSDPGGGIPTWNDPIPWLGGRWGAGDILGYMEAGALSLLRNASASREAWLANFAAVAERAVAGWPKWPRAWVVPADPGSDASLAELSRILRTAQVEIDVSKGDLIDGDQTWPPGSLVIDMRQPYAAFVQMLLAPQDYPGRLEYPGGPPKAPYDVTAHNLPLFLGLRAMPTRRMPQGEMERQTGTTVPRSRVIEGLSGRPGILVGLYQPWVPATDEGWTRWLFDRYEIPYATLHDQAIRQGDLARRFTSVVLPSVDPSVLDEGWAPGSMPVEFTGGLGTAGVQALRDFVEGGGTLVALGRSASWASDRLGLPVVDRLRGQPNDVFFAPGAQVSLVIDTTTSTGRHMRARTAAWIEGGAAFDLPANSAAVSVATYGARPSVLSGWVHGASALAGASAVVEVPFGRGKVVLFGIDPQQRGLSMATFPLLFNALKPRP
ncbi:MAG: hypothetical protein KJO44_03210 [Gemmatimonadetes bacterium]|nr:hypothetical protein [Gemmatimonadota bacterium]